MSSTAEHLQKYCGLTEKQVLDLKHHHWGNQIHKNQLNFFVVQGLVQRDGRLSICGLFALARAQSILNFTFRPAPAEFTADELSKLSENVSRMARMKLPYKGIRLRSIHLKALIAVGRSPGILRANLLRVYGEQTIDDLDKDEMIIVREPNVALSARYGPRYPSVRGLTILNWCLLQLE